MSRQVSTVFTLLIVLYVVHASTIVNIVQTSKSGDRLTPQATVQFTTGPVSGRVLKVNSGATYQTMFGFGGALTEASAYVFSGLNSALQQEVLNAYYSPKGLGYTIGRVHMNSCDFSLNTYSCDDVAGDYELKHFNINRDRKYLLPLVQRAFNTVSLHRQRSDEKYVGMNDLKLFLTPWSPPAWMKSNHNMNGSYVPGLIDDDRVYTAWALHFSKFITEYAKEGVPFWGLTVQNEAEFAAPWEACVYRPEDESNFIKKYLGPRMKKDYPNIKIMMFDHNRDDVLKWANVLLSDPETSQYVDGVAFHWYSNGDYEHLSSINEAFPDKWMLATEACNCPGVVLNDWARGISYAFDIINDVNNFAVGWTDWNILLDMQGGPNHLKNFCDAPIVADVQSQQIHYQVNYFVMGHFSKYVPPNSKRVDSIFSSSSDIPSTVLATAFILPDSTTVTVIVVNDGDADFEFNIFDVKLNQTASTKVPSHSIRTYTYKTS